MNQDQIIDKKYKEVAPRDVIYERLRHLIVANNYSPNVRIPSERELCMSWNVNRMTLRSAIGRLVNEGVLYKKKGSGTYIAEKKIRRNLKELNSMTRDMQNRGLTLKTRLVSFRKMESTKEISSHLNIPLGTEIYELIRLRAHGDTPLLLEINCLSATLFPDLMYYDFSHASLYAVFEEEYGVRVVQGQERIGVTYATEEEKLLEVSKDFPLFIVSGTTESEKGETIEYYRALFRSDKYEMFTEIYP